MSTAKANNIVARDTLERTNTELYKELENENFKAVLLGTLDGIEGTNGYISATSNTGIRIKENKVAPQLNVPNSSLLQHYAVFQKATRLLVICGQCIGLNPVLGILEKDPTKVRFTVFSWRFLYSVLIGIGQMIATFLCFYRLFKATATIDMIGFVSFYASTFITTVLFIRIAAKWSTLVKEISQTALDEYNDPKIKFKCDTASILILGLAILEHILSLIARVAEVTDCYPEYKDYYRGYIEKNFPWLFELELPYYLPLGITLQFVNIVSTMNWNYSDLFIICMSFYLTSTLERINNKIILAGGRYLPSSYWRALREDYNKATQLVRSFDDVISSIIFASFATNLFFICLQLFNVLANGIKHGLSVDKCPNFPSGPFGGYEHAIYFAFSLSFVLGRSLAVSLIAANVHSASLIAAPALYDVPSPVFCGEVQRFLEQLHGDNVALSGLQFFYVTKGLVLTVAGTIVTYELVLLQFTGEDLLKTK